MESGGKGFQAERRDSCQDVASPEEARPCAQREDVNEERGSQILWLSGFGWALGSMLRASGNRAVYSYCVFQKITSRMHTLGEVVCARVNTYSLI